MSEYIYFELQTAIVKQIPIRSNFYVYRLPKSCLATVELAVRQRSIDLDDPSNLGYPEKFAEFLGRRDTHWDQKKGLPIPFEAREY